MQLQYSMINRYENTETLETFSPPPTNSFQPLSPPDSTANIVKSSEGPSRDHVSRRRDIYGGYKTLQSAPHCSGYRLLSIIFVWSMVVFKVKSPLLLKASWLLFWPVIPAWARRENITRTARNLDYIRLYSLQLVLIAFTKQENHVMSRDKFK